MLMLVKQGNCLEVTLPLMRIICHILVWAVSEKQRTGGFTKTQYLWIHWSQHGWCPSRLHPANTKGFWSRRKVWVRNSVGHLVRHGWGALPVKSGTFFNLKQEEKKELWIQVVWRPLSVIPLKPVEPFSQSVFPISHSKNKNNPS